MLLASNSQYGNGGRPDVEVTTGQSVQDVLICHNERKAQIDIDGERIAAGV